MESFVFIIVAVFNKLPAPTPPSSEKPPAFIPAIALLDVTISH
ncbi:MAG: hypothetical protein V8R82_00815 [Clostridia bacterium]